MSHIDHVINEVKRLSGGSFSKLCSLPDDELLDKYEEEIGFQFSPDYRKMLKNLNDVRFNTKEILSVTKERNSPAELATELYDARKLGVPHDWLPFCQDNGDYYCLLPDGTVRYYSLDGATDEKWDDLASWIQQVWIDGN